MRREFITLKNTFKRFCEIERDLVKFGDFRTIFEINTRHMADSEMLPAIF